MKWRAAFHARMKEEVARLREAGDLTDTSIFVSERALALLREMRHGGMQQPEIAALLGCSVSKLQAILTTADRPTLRRRKRGKNARNGQEIANRRHDMREMVAGGVKGKEVAAMMGCTRQEVSRVTAGLSKPGRPSKLNDSTRALVRVWAESGMPWEEIAKEVGMTVRGLRYLVHEEQARHPGDALARVSELAGQMEWNLSEAQLADLDRHLGDDPTLPDGP